MASSLTSSSDTLLASADFAIEQNTIISRLTLLCCQYGSIDDICAHVQRNAIIIYTCENEMQRYASNIGLYACDCVERNEDMQPVPNLYAKHKSSI